MVIVSTVVLVRGILGGTDSDVALALACFGGGSMAAALLLPRLLDRVADRSIMLSSAGVLGGALIAFAAIASVPESTKWLWPAPAVDVDACWAWPTPLS